MKLEIASTTRKRLRGLAHGLSPIVHVGKSGLTDRLVAELDRALGEHELVKVRIVVGKAERNALAEALADRLDAALAGVVGHVAILFRQNEDPADRKYSIEI